MTAPLRVQALFSLLCDLAPGGFALGLHLRFATPTFEAVTYPPAWREEYAREGFLLRDPLVVWALAHRGRASWDALAAQDPAGVMARAGAHGLRHGVAISLERDGSLSIAGFARGDRAFTAGEAAELEVALAGLHEAAAGDTERPAALRAELHRLSAAFTHR